MPTATRSSSRDRLLDAAVAVIRAQGLHATTVDDLCAEAGVSKGAFFHHFATKDDLAIAAADYWSVTTGRLFEDAPYHDHEDPADRVLAYLDFRASIIGDAIERYTCLVGTMVQEAYATHPAIRDACAESILGHAATLEADIADALVAAEVDVEDIMAEAESLARHTQVVLQGAFVVSKAANDPAIALASIDHLRHYFELLFHRDRGA
jgi:TetR/AcrR family transcriptional regulator, transcriptional repressor for nem operon